MSEVSIEEVLYPHYITQRVALYNPEQLSPVFCDDINPDEQEILERYFSLARISNNRARAYQKLGASNQTHHYKQRVDGLSIYLSGERGEGHHSILAEDRSYALTPAFDELRYVSHSEARVAIQGVQYHLSSSLLSSRGKPPFPHVPSFLSQDSVTIIRQTLNPERWDKWDQPEPETITIRKATAPERDMFGLEIHKQQESNLLALKVFEDSIDRLERYAKSSKALIRQYNNREARFDLPSVAIPGALMRLTYDTPTDGAEKLLMHITRTNPGEQSTQLQLHIWDFLAAEATGERPGDSFVDDLRYQAANDISFWLVRKETANGQEVIFETSVQGVQPILPTDQDKRYEQGIKTCEQLLDSYFTALKAQKQTVPTAAERRQMLKRDPLFLRILRQVSK